MPLLALSVRFTVAGSSDLGVLCVRLQSVVTRAWVLSTAQSGKALHQAHIVSALFCSSMALGPNTSVPGFLGAHPQGTVTWALATLQLAWSKLDIVSWQDIPSPLLCATG